MSRLPSFLYRFADCQVLLNGLVIADTMDTRIVNVVVEDQVDLPSMFSIDVRAGEVELSRIPWLNGSMMFAIGDAVQINMGYEKPEVLIRGEITALDLEFSGGHLPRLTVRGYDKRHRLQRGRKTRTFTSQKDSDIVRRIAGERGFRARVTDSETVHEFVMQPDQSDWEFLTERARRINFELVMEGNELLFRRRGEGSGPIVSLKLGEELTEFTPRLSSVGQISELVVRSWDVNKSELITATAVGTSVRAMSRDGKVAPTLVSAAFGTATETISAPPSALNGAGEAGMLARARLGIVALGLIQADGICSGSSSIRAGNMVRIDGVGNRFNGEYYVASASHRYDGDGYSTHIKTMRNSS